MRVDPSVGAIARVFALTFAWSALPVIACSARLPHPPYVAQPSTALTETPFPPPPARAENVPPRPTDDAVWIDGEWSWRARRWAWKAGRWVVAPAGCAFSPWTATRAPNGTYYFAPGVWRDAKGAAVSDPTPLAKGRPTSGVVFDAEGDVEREGSLRGARSPRGADGGT